ncbi:hypothetical protein HOY80DRAFT_740295 [Tuber brumale]|nr:hypothetical protein HOY80DRAFT_740295 [Tuber brumale]
MVTGLVYTEVNRSADHRRERSRVKKSLTAEARLIRRMRGTTPAKQKAYANKAGRSLLRSIHKMESDIVDLQNKVHEQEDNHIRSTKYLTEELMILRPLKENAVAIRRRFFATHRRSQDEMEHDDPLTIDSGNKSAHRGDVCLDVCLFKNRLIEYDDTFCTLYGLSWSDAEALLVMSQSVGTVYTGDCVFGCSALALFVYLTVTTIRVRKTSMRDERPCLRHHRPPLVVDPPSGTCFSCFDFLDWRCKHR